jgi:glycerophosphoryl diester phosphodiesterase
MKRTRDSPTIVAHRGLHERCPENSLAAFSAAWRRGIVWCECDVHLSADGVAVVIHDETLDRTTTGSGPVASKSWAQLSRLRLRGPNGKPTDQFIPWLDQALRMPRGCRLIVETKPMLGQRILPIARQVLRKRGLLQSFHAPDIVLARRSLGPRLDCAVLADQIVPMPRAVRRLHVDYRVLDKQTIQRLTAAGISVGAWTVNQQREIRKLARWGVATIFTNRPLLAREIVARP